MKFQAARKTAVAVLAGAAWTLLLSSRPASAGGAWVPDPGDGDVELGFSRKTASSSWNTSGHPYTNTTNVNGTPTISYHDFRYGYLTGEVGLVRNLSFDFVFTYLYGLEGPHGNEEKNAGFSDAWLGLKYQIHRGTIPMAVGFVYRTPILYDLPGAYSRYLYDSHGNIRANSPEWRGLLKHDYTLAYLASRSLAEGRGWVNFSAGYTWREGAPADQIPLSAEAAYPIFGPVDAKGTAYFQRSLGNDSPSGPDDRFGASARNNFNDASFLRLGAALFVNFDAKRRWFGEIGYNQWVWGVSARRYREPYLSVGHNF
jgi:hypothetical protein